MAVHFRHTRSLATTVGLLLATVGPLVAQQRPGFQASGGAANAPLDLLSPTFIAPAPRLAAPQPAVGGTVPSAAAAMPVLHAPLPLPRPIDAPRPVITQASAPPPVAAGVVAPQPAGMAQPVVEPPAAPVETSRADDYPDDDRRDQVIIPGAYVRSNRQSGAEAIAAATSQPAPQPPALPERTIAFAAPVPPARPGELRGSVAPSPVPGTGPTLASASSTPVVLSSAGTATTMVIPAGPAGAPAGMAPQVVTSPTRATGPVLASLPPQGGTADWPRYVPGAAAVERNLGIAGERVMPDPGVPLACLPAPVRRALNDVALRFGPILVRSTHRGNGRFVRTDEFRGSYHKDCRAADFRVSGDGAAVLAYLRQRHDLGGVKRYRNGLLHIDDGPRRSW
ncbi:hypothetical protein E8L99_20725 [Phreatobacter aquaticus]|uniref:Peptidase M15A C-terminal domain-containing protein n=1 Tax=Phreatobacter aquaticus TaxID=2570229 RepID=A0A4D7QPV7_9HYPH|nr:hypothetical protein [Phreatobacter aquaticus]QCK88003.1 hypothetical protein E8L99_20725 [Phreatobacter aquaticus]